MRFLLGPLDVLAREALRPLIICDVQRDGMQKKQQLTDFHENPKFKLQDITEHPK